MRVIMTRTCTFTSMYRPVDVSRSFLLSLSPFARISIRRTRIAARICRYNANKAHKHAAHMYRAYNIRAPDEAIVRRATAHLLPARSSSCSIFPSVPYFICNTSMSSFFPLPFFSSHARPDLHALFLPPRLFVCLFETIGGKFGPDTGRGNCVERERERVSNDKVHLVGNGCESAIKFGE